MRSEEKKAAKQRILETATSLFAKKGFASVGVREIAEKASVNISMISYYFNGKSGILCTILKDFLEGYFALFEVLKLPGLSVEERIRELIHRIVFYVRENRDAGIVLYNEMVLQNPDVYEIKAQGISRILKRLEVIFYELHIDPDDKTLIGIVGPALMGIVFTHFRNRAAFSEFFQLKTDDTFYERYADTVATLFLRGVTGLAAQYQKKE